MTRDEYADRLAEVGAQLVGRVRDDDPQANHRWLHSMLPDPADREALLYVLAAAVPAEVPWLHLTAWRRTGGGRPLRPLRPCGTAAAYKRHRDRGEEPCDPCVQAYRLSERERKRAQREEAA